MFQEINSGENVRLLEDYFSELTIAKCPTNLLREHKFCIHYLKSQERIQQLFCNESLLEYWMIKCNLRDGVMLGAINKASLHDES